MNGVKLAFAPRTDSNRLNSFTCSKLTRGDLKTVGYSESKHEIAGNFLPQRLSMHFVLTNA